jgi:hypothetical protein
MSEIEVITKSRLAAYGTCQRLHDLQYVRGYRPLVEGESMAWGSLIHAGLEAWWKAYQRGAGLLALPEAEAAMVAYRAQHAAALDDAAFVRAAVLMVAYDARWAPSMGEFEVIGVEVEFVATIPGRKRLRVAGKIDALVRKIADGSIWYVEHKTSGADLSAGSTYWQRLRMDPQVSIYFGGVRAIGHEPHGCIYDVLVRPDQRPFKATPVELRKYTKATAKEPSRLYANQREADETIDEFRARLAAALGAAPDAFFARAEVVRLETEIEESQRDVEELALQIRGGPLTGQSARNPNACFLYNRPCPFLSACDGTASLDDETKFRRTDTQHEELSVTT